MARINSKNKGNTNERKIAKLLSEALDPFKFIRVASSGAFLGGKNFAVRENLFSDDAAQNYIGDIVCTNEKVVNKKFRFVIEAKHYKTPDSFESLFTGKHKVYGWLDEVSIDCVKVNKDGIVIFKWNNTSYFCAVRPHIELPCKFMTLQTGDKICLLNDLLTVPEFWEV